MLLHSLKARLLSLHKKFKTTFLEHLEAMKDLDNTKNIQKKNKNLSSFSTNIFDTLITSSFQSMPTSNQFKQVFKLIDSNGDGKISPLELSDMLVRLGYEKSEAVREAEGIVRAMDCDGDGVINLDEFVNAVAVKESSKDHLMDAFLVFDADKNGLISALELRNVLNSLGCCNCSLQQCRLMIKAVDKDGDGFVNFDEFSSMMIQNT